MSYISKLEELDLIIAKIEDGQWGAYKSVEDLPHNPIAESQSLEDLGFEVEQALAKPKSFEKYETVWVKQIGGWAKGIITDIYLDNGLQKVRVCISDEWTRTHDYITVAWGHIRKFNGDWRIGDVCWVINSDLEDRAKVLITKQHLKKKQIYGSPKSHWHRVLWSKDTMHKTQDGFISAIPRPDVNI